MTLVIASLTSLPLSSFSSAAAAFFVATFSASPFRSFALPPFDFAFVLNFAAADSCTNERWRRQFGVETRENEIQCHRHGISFTNRMLSGRHQNGSNSNYQILPGHFQILFDLSLGLFYVAPLAVAEQELYILTVRGRGHETCNSCRSQLASSLPPFVFCEK